MICQNNFKFIRYFSHQPTIPITHHPYVKINVLMIRSIRFHSFEAAWPSTIRIGLLKCHHFDFYRKNGILVSYRICIVRSDVWTLNMLNKVWNCYRIMLFDSWLALKINHIFGAFHSIRIFYWGYLRSKVQCFGIFRLVGWFSLVFSVQPTIYIVYMLFLSTVTVATVTIRFIPKKILSNFHFFFFSSFDMI